MNKDSYCSYCGTEFLSKGTYPRECVTCSNFIWLNPKPAVVVLIPVREEFFVVGRGGFANSGVRYGILIQKRNIEPKKGEWALHSGYIDQGETWQHAAAREIQEEIGLETNSNDYKLFNVLSSKDHILISCTYQKPITNIEQLNFVPNQEVSELGIMYEDTELAFPSHTECANLYLKDLQRR